MNKINLPKRLVVTGRIASVKTVDPETNGKFSSDTDIVTIETADRLDGSESDGTMQRIVLNIGHSMSNSFAKRHILFEGNFVSFDIDVCKDGVTQYEDAAGDIQFHTEDHNAVRDMFNASDESVRNILYPETLASAFKANSKIFIGMEIPTVAQISANTADKAIDGAIARLIDKRNSHVLSDAERGTVTKTDRKSNLEDQIEKLDKRIAEAPDALKPSLTGKRERLNAELLAMN